MIGFLLKNNLARIGSSEISTCSLADLFEQRERNVPLASADVPGGGRLRELFGTEIDLSDTNR